jgi:hypothetical protein
LESFTFYDNANGTILRSFEGFEYPSVRDVIEDISGKGGATYVTSKFGRRLVSWSGDLVSSSVFTLRRTMLEALRQQGRMKLIKFTTYDDLALQFEAEITKVLNPYTHSIHSFLIEAVAADWRFFSQAEVEDEVEDGAVGVISNLGNEETDPVFRIDGPGTSFFVDTWKYRKKITIDYTKVEDDETDFPFLVSHTDTDLAKALASGYDIVFTDASGNKLPHEIEKFDNTTGELVAWVKVPSLSSTEDTEIYIYYGNSNSPDQQDPDNVWADDSKAVYHFKTGALTEDSSEGEHTLTPGGDPAEGVGVFDGGADLDGNDRFIAVDHADFKPTGPFTIIGLLKSNGGTNDDAFSSWSQNPNAAGLKLGISASGKATIFSGKNTGAVVGTDQQYASGLTTINDNAWHFVIGTWDGSYLRIYVDGVLNGGPVAWANAPAYAATNYVRVGCSNNTGSDTRVWIGALDEIRLVNGVAFDANLCKTIFNNYISPSTFYDLADEETFNELSFTIDRELELGEYIEVNVNERTILLNGETPIYSNFEGDFITLQPGGNIVLFNAIGGDANTLLTITFRHAYNGL